MESALLFTSIPPRLRGRPFDPAAAGSLQMRAIRSWQEAGFRPVSVNSSTEIAVDTSLGDRLRRAGVESVAVPVEPARGNRQGRLVPFLDFLAAVAASPGPVAAAITNADIVFARAGGTPLAEAVARLDRRTQLLAQRTDLFPTPDGPTVTAVNLHGFDFFAFDRSSIAGAIPFLAPDLVMGMPWWDHYLPLAMMAAGCRPRLVHPAWILHETHADRWSRSDYCRIGREAARRLAATLRGGGPDDARGWLSVHESRLAASGANGVIDRLSRATAARTWAPDAITVRSLGQLAAANVAFLLQAATAGPAPGDGAVVQR